MQKQKFVYVTPSSSSRRRSRPSLFTLFALATLTVGLLILGVGLAFLLFGPLLLAAGAALVVFAALVLLILLLVRGLRWVLTRLVEHVRQTAFSHAISPALNLLLRQLANQLVDFLLEWLDQGSGQSSAHPGRPGKKYKRRRSRFALSAT
jgi:Flp pilus assembly protein TadB